MEELEEEEGYIILNPSVQFFPLLNQAPPLFSPPHSPQKTFCYVTLLLDGSNNRVETGISSAHDTIPPGAIPPGAIPPDAIPSNAIPHDTIPPDAKSHDTIPPDAISHNATIPLDAISHNATIPHCERSRRTSTCTSAAKSQKQKEELGLVLFV